MVNKFFYFLFLFFPLFIFVFIFEDICFAQSISINNKLIHNVNFNNIQNGSETYNFCSSDKPLDDSANQIQLKKLTDFIHSYLKTNSFPLPSEFKATKIVAQNAKLFNQWDCNSKKTLTTHSPLTIHFEQIISLHLNDQLNWSISIEGARIIIDLDIDGKISEVRFNNIIILPEIKFADFKIDHIALSAHELDHLIKQLEIFESQNLQIPNFKISTFLPNTVHDLPDSISDTISDTITDKIAFLNSKTTATFPLLKMTHQWFQQWHQVLNDFKSTHNESIFKNLDIYNFIKIAESLKPKTVFILTRPSENGERQFFIRMHAPFFLSSILEFEINIDKQTLTLTRAESLFNEHLLTEPMRPVSQSKVKSTSTLTSTSISTSVSNSNSISHSNSTPTSILTSTSAALPIITLPNNSTIKLSSSPLELNSPNNNNNNNNNNSDAQKELAVQIPNIHIQSFDLKNALNIWSIIPVPDLFSNPFSRFMKPTDNPSTQFTKSSIQTITQFYAQRYHRSSYDNKDADISAFIDITLSEMAENAAWAKAPFNRFLIGSGGNAFKNLNSATDVIGHEYFHAITDNENEIINENQSGAINEHIADIMGLAAKFATVHSQNIDINNMLLIGTTILSENNLKQEMEKQPNRPPISALRDLLRPERSLNPLYKNITEAVTFGFFCKPTSDNDNCGVHIQSGIPSFAIANSIKQIAENFRARQIIEPEKEALLQTADIIYITALNHLSGNPTFEEYTTQFIKECRLKTANQQTQATPLVDSDCDIYQTQFIKAGIYSNN